MLDLVSWASRQHQDRGIGVYDRALQASRAALEHAASDLLISSDLIDRISYIAGVLADGVALNWHTYGDRSRAAEQMDPAESVLVGWLRSQLDPSGASNRSMVIETARIRTNVPPLPHISRCENVPTSARIVDSLSDPLAVSTSSTKKAGEGSDVRLTTL